jgi:hypothetical protein
MDGPVLRRETPRPGGLDRLRFALERLLLRGLGYRLLLAASILAAVVLVTGGLVALLDAEFSGLNEAVWWAFLRLTDPGYLGDDEGVARRSISTVLTVLGLLLFVGLLVAILIQWLNETLSKLKSGVTPVAASDHVVILGWTHRTPTIVSELLRTRNRVARFLERRGARELSIVILAARVDEALVRELRERLGKLWNDRQVVLRSGSPLRIDDLERVAFRDAAVLILPGADFAEQNPESVDAQTVKTLLSVSQHSGESGSARPLAVATVYDARKAEVARRAYGADSEIVAADEIISRLIAQSVRQRGLCAVFSELLTLGEGNALYVRQLEDQSGTRFRDLSGTFSRAILLGTVRPGDRGIALNPDPDTVLENEDLLVFVARSFEDCALRMAPDPSAPTPALPAPRPALERRRRVLVLGWSCKVPALLREFECYGGAVEVDIVSSTPLEEREKALERDAAETPSDRVRQIEASFLVPSVLERLEPQCYDNIVLLASERLSKQEQADATTVSSYLMLRGLIPENGEHPVLFVELLDEENRFLFSKEGEDVIVSPMLVSYVLSQVALRRELAAVVAELLRPWGAQIVLRPSQEYLAANGPVHFEDLERAAAARGEIALGIRRPVAGLDLNPDRAAVWDLAADDEVVVLASYAEPDVQR